MPSSKHPPARFYADGDRVYREPATTDSGVKLGYWLCTMGPGTPEEGAAFLAEILNRAIEANIITE